MLWHLQSLAGMQKIMLYVFLFSFLYKMQWVFGELWNAISQFGLFAWDYCGCKVRSVWELDGCYSGCEWWELQVLVIYLPFLSPRQETFQILEAGLYSHQWLPTNTHSNRSSNNQSTAELFGLAHLDHPI